jgi:hypothetical protein
MQGDKPTKEELEFRLAELDAFVKRYNLERFGALLDSLLATIQEMIRVGEIPGTKEGVAQVMTMITKAYTGIGAQLERFTAAAAQEMLNETKQLVRPN